MAERGVLEVRGVPPGAEEELVVLYFESRRRSGGGPVRSCQRLGPLLFLTFESPQDAQNVLARSSHRLGGADLGVRPAPPWDPTHLLLRGVPPGTPPELLEPQVETLLGRPRGSFGLCRGPAPGWGLLRLRDPVTPHGGCGGAGVTAGVAGCPQPPRVTRGLVPQSWRQRSVERSGGGPGGPALLRVPGTPPGAGAGGGGAEPRPAGALLREPAQRRRQRAGGAGAGGGGRGRRHLPGGGSGPAGAAEAAPAAGRGAGAGPPTGPSWRGWGGTRPPPRVRPPRRTPRLCRSRQRPARARAGSRQGRRQEGATCPGSGRLLTPWVMRTRTRMRTRMRTGARRRPRTGSPRSRRPRRVGAGRGAGAGGAGSAAVPAAALPGPAGQHRRGLPAAAGRGGPRRVPGARGDGPVPGRGRVPAEPPGHREAARGDAAVPRRRPVPVGRGRAEPHPAAGEPLPVRHRPGRRRLEPPEPPGTHRHRGGRRGRHRGHRAGPCHRAPLSRSRSWRSCCPRAAAGTPLPAAPRSQRWDLLDDGDNGDGLRSDIEEIKELLAALRPGEAGGDRDPASQPGDVLGAEQDPEAEPPAAAAGEGAGGPPASGRGAEEEEEEAQMVLAIQRSMDNTRREEEELERATALSLRSYRQEEEEEEEEDAGLLAALEASLEEALPAADTAWVTLFSSCEEMAAAAGAGAGAGAGGAAAGAGGGERAAAAGAAGLLPPLPDPPAAQTRRAALPGRRHRHAARLPRLHPPPPPVTLTSCSGVCRHRSVTLLRPRAGCAGTPPAPPSPTPARPRRCWRRLGCAGSAGWTCCWTGGPSPSIWCGCRSTTSAAPRAVAVSRSRPPTESARRLLGPAALGLEEEVRLMPLAEDSEEFRDTTRHFYETLEELRGPNRRRQAWRRRTPVPTVERVLFHGTTEPSSREICLHGFNRSFCGKNAALYGLGVYFAAEAAVSVQERYSPRGPDGNKFVFVAKVLTGDVVDNPRHPGIFVIFNDTQAYPQYLISCRWHGDPP
ncbi:unnamed protein product [Bubo scandiacus]